MAFYVSGFADEIDEKIINQFKHLNTLGIEYFEVRGVDGKNIADLNECEVKNLKEKMDEHKIKASSIGSPIGKIGILDDFEEHLDKFARVIDTAKYIGAPYIRMFSFYIPEGESDKHRDEVFRRLETMTRIAEEKNITLLHENEKGIWGESAKNCVEIFENIPSKNLRAVFDPANFVQCGETDIPACLELLKPYVEYFHVKDAKGQTVVPAGKGDAEFPRLITILKGMGKDMCLSLEPHLCDFSGFANLEKEGNLKLAEASGSEMFTLAYNSLKELLNA